MIDKKKKPSPINWTDWCMEPYEGDTLPAPVLHDEPPHRQSSVLGADGDPMTISMPRRAIGFDLRPRQNRREPHQ
jgi:hypothetical protein